MKNKFRYLVFAAILPASCSTINETSKQQMEKGIYAVKNYSKERFFVDADEESLTIYPVTKPNRHWIIDTSLSKPVHINTSDPNNRTQFKFLRRSLDLDVMTILFKYRPYTAGFPNQLNTNFNAAEFIGHRTDLYILSYDKDPLKRYNRTINHFAFSFGGFIGLGATQMNPFVTNNNIASEYDGVVITKGIAALVGVGEFTFGAAVGLDHLMDRNRRVWIYQGKPWVGFTVGFNIN